MVMKGLCFLPYTKVQFTVAHRYHSAKKNIYNHLQPPEVANFCHGGCNY